MPAIHACTHTDIQTCQPYTHAHTHRHTDMPAIHACTHTRTQHEHSMTTTSRHEIILCPLHISRSDAPIGLRCSRRQIGTKPSDVASAHHSHCPNGAQCVHSRRLVQGSRTILYDSLVGTVKESYLLQLSVALYTFGSRSAGGVGQY